MKAHYRITYDRGRGFVYIFFDDFPRVEVTINLPLGILEGEIEKVHYSRVQTNNWVKYAHEPFHPYALRVPAAPLWVGLVLVPYPQQGPLTATKLQGFARTLIELVANLETFTAQAQRGDYEK